MPVKTNRTDRNPPPKSFDELVRMMPPMAIRDEVHHTTTVEVIDRLMRIDRLSPGQTEYLETLVELVEAYEAKHHAIDLAGINGLRALQHVTSQSGFSASDLARLLGVHPSLGSKLLKGERNLTWEHAKKLGAHFKLAPTVFMD